VDTISTADVQITTSCQTFLQKDFHPAEKAYTRRRLMVMKTALSYHHVLLLGRGQSATLRPSLYWLLAPLTYVHPTRTHSAVAILPCPPCRVHPAVSRSH
jgi:hypothetical protein